MLHKMDGVFDYGGDRVSAGCNWRLMSKERIRTSK